ncbi:hypothetical protein JCM21738_1143 [Mesobacillus boroniphilus JCM 21738]|uniref:Uncharacterized protein n=1 Tax=Mesobacillus boroniphilus JCM 21738 TaxID=1294265 RepID=W4RKP2_9BACI|nr:hypothetical protein JCM21738_1143 [Mesobacillus boroniphilus JCM 21738]
MYSNSFTAPPNLIFLQKEWIPSAVFHNQDKKSFKVDENNLINGISSLKWQK